TGRIFWNSWGYCSTTPSNGRAAGCGSGCMAASGSSSSPSRTTALASPPNCAAGCSPAASAWMKPSPAPGWGWPSRRTSSSSTRAGSSSARQPWAGWRCPCSCRAAPANSALAALPRLAAAGVEIDLVAPAVGRHQLDFPQPAVVVLQLRFDHLRARILLPRLGHGLLDVDGRGQIEPGGHRQAAAEATDDGKSGDDGSHALFHGCLSWLTGEPSLMPRAETRLNARPAKARPLTSGRRTHSSWSTDSSGVMTAWKNRPASFATARRWKQSACAFWKRPAEPQLPAPSHARPAVAIAAPCLPAPLLRQTRSSACVCWPRTATSSAIWPPPVGSNRRAANERGSRRRALALLSACRIGCGDERQLD